MEPGPPGLARFAPRLLVHVGEHQHLAGVGVLHDCGHQALREIHVHRLTSSPRADNSRFTSRIETSPKWKIDAASAASAPPSVIAAYMCCADPAPPDAITGSRRAS